MQSNGIQLSELTGILDNLYPSFLAEEWDSVGLHFGHQNAKVKKIMTTLDVRPEVVQEAIQLGVDTIIVHHPVLFTPIARFDYSTPELRMYSEIIKHDLNVFVLHTNLDKAKNGMNDWLAKALELEETQELEESEDGYSGLGRIGYLPEKLNREKLVAYVKDKLDARFLSIIEKAEKATYQKIAIVGGASFDSIAAAVRKEADVFITGDITFHKGQDAYEHDLLTIDSGHYIEHIFKEKMASLIQQLKKQNQWDIEVIQSKVNTNPFTYE